jgi:hypothetical protein
MFQPSLTQSDLSSPHRAPEKRVSRLRLDALVLPRKQGLAGLHERFLGLP